MPILKVQLVRRAPEGEIMVKVALTSEKRPDVTSEGYVDPDVENLEYQVAVLAGTIAEHQCTIYGDGHDPHQIAAAAEKMVKKLKKKGNLKNQRIEKEFVG